MPWVTDHPPIPVDLNTCVQCGLCLPSCPTFRLTGRETDSPRGRLTAMLGVAAGLEVDDAFAGIMSSCVQCRACEVVCPAFVPFGRAMEAARAEVAAQTGGPGMRIRRLTVGWMVRRRGLVWSSGRLARLIVRARLAWVLPRPIRAAVAGMRRDGDTGRSVVGTKRPSVGERRGVAALVSGCVMDSWFRGVHDATIELLTRAGYDVVVPESQTCCGALAAHDGWVDDAKAMAATNVEAFAGVDLVVANAAGCGAHLKEYEHWAAEGHDLASRVRDITEVVEGAIADGRLPTLSKHRGVVGVQDPCHLRHAQRIVEEPRRVLSAAGYTVVEIDPNARCCGAGGLYSVVEPQMSNDLGAAKAEQIEQAGVEIVASANPGCEMQLRSHTGGSVRIAHPVELYWEAIEASLLRSTHD